MISPTTAYADYVFCDTTSVVPEALSEHTSPIQLPATVVWQFAFDQFAGMDNASVQPELDPYIQQEEFPHYYEPLIFDWSPIQVRILDEVKQLGEQLHADH